jgi:hypothetical protein
MRELFPFVDFIHLNYFLTFSKLRPIIDDGEGDIALWNKEIAKYFQGESLTFRAVAFHLFLYNYSLVTHVRNVRNPQAKIL